MSVVGVWVGAVEGACLQVYLPVLSRYSSKLLGSVLFFSRAVQHEAPCTQHIASATPVSAISLDGLFGNSLMEVI